MAQGADDESSGAAKIDVTISIWKDFGRIATPARPLLQLNDPNTPEIRKNRTPNRPGLYHTISQTISAGDLRKGKLVYPT